MSRAALCNACWMAACWPETRAYRRACRQVRPTQRELLKDLIRANRDAWWGRKYSFASLRTIEDFQRAVPLTTYSDYAPLVERIACGELQVLTREPVELLEPTGGSTSGEKLIPYTASLRRSFRRAIRVWMGDLFSSRPAVRRGNAYWSITPVVRSMRTTVGGVRIGFDDDASYLAGPERLWLAGALAVPPQVAACSTVPAAQYASLFFLLRCEQLALVSVWSPTFFSELLRFLGENWEPLCDDLERGAMSDALAPRPEKVLPGPFSPCQTRADELRSLFRNASRPVDWAGAIWPRLSLVSCWADGPSAVYAQALRCQLPGIELQPKGLLATEAFVSLPLIGLPGAALAVRSHFFEFQPVDAAGSVLGTSVVLADEVEVGRHYRVIVTTSGGLYRYQLMDQVEVVGFYEQAPLMRFVGKADDTSDLVGEKLAAAHVQAALTHATETLGLAPTFARLTAVAGRPPCYVLEIAEPRLIDNLPLQAHLSQLVSAGLNANPAYSYAHELGQLGPLQIAAITSQRAAELWAVELQQRLQGGQRAGDVKPRVLAAKVGWVKRNKTSPL